MHILPSFMPTELMAVVVKKDKKLKLKRVPKEAVEGLYLKGMSTF